VTTDSRIGIVVLAAGNASRFGSAKQQVPVEGVPLVRRAAEAAMNTGASVVVVTGAHRELVEENLSGLSVSLAFNPDWQLGMGGSIACGVRHLEKTAAAVDAIIISLADQPMITTTELTQLIGAHRQTPGRIVAAKYDGVLGAPCLFPRKYFNDLANLSGAHGARVVLERHADEVDALSMPMAATDIDTPEDYARLTGVSKKE
jgi:molybdenum cofactor cytidylyltransferase